MMLTLRGGVAGVVLFWVCGLLGSLPVFGQESREVRITISGAQGNHNATYAKTPVHLSMSKKEKIVWVFTNETGEDHDVEFVDFKVKGGAAAMPVSYEGPGRKRVNRNRGTVTITATLSAQAIIGATYVYKVRVGNKDFDPELIIDP